MDYLPLIKQPIDKELTEFIDLFNATLTHGDGLLEQVLKHIRKRGGKRMRPQLILLIAKAFGEVNEISKLAAVGLELLHTASLVHDDVVDESNERRGQASVNASYDNKVAVLVGDFILSTALLSVSKTRNHEIVDELSELGRTLSNGEILQLTNISNKEISEEIYYNVIKQKTAALFESCAKIGALSVNAAMEDIEAAARFGQTLGIIFQIRDDIFDYYAEKNVGKPTGNDMQEGKLTLPCIYAVNNSGNSEMYHLAMKVRNHNVTKEEIAQLVDFTKQNGGIEYAVQRMRFYHDEAQRFIDKYVNKPEIKAALQAYLDFMSERVF